MWYIRKKFTATTYLNLVMDISGQIDFYFSANEYYLSRNIYTYVKKRKKKKTER